MNKYELKNGDELILRNGDELYHLNGTLYRLRGDGSLVPIRYQLRGDESLVPISEKNFDDDLRYIVDNNFDVMKVVYEDEIVFDRGVDWNEVAMGTPVIAWDDGIDNMYEGKFVYYDSTDDENKYLVLVSYERYIEDGITVEETDAVWFNRCRLKEGI